MKHLILSIACFVGCGISMFAGLIATTSPHMRISPIAKFACWTLTAVFFVLHIATDVRRQRLNQRNPKTTCLSCGYNLTGNTTGICPECGTRIPP